MTWTDTSVKDASGTTVTRKMLSAVGQDTMTNSPSMAIASDQTPISVTPLITNPSSVLTRPANTTAYSAADLIANNTTAGSITVPSVTIARTSGGNAKLNRLRLLTNKTSGMGSINIAVELWSAAPTFTNGDNGAYAVATGAANYLGSTQFSFTQVADGAYATAPIVDGPLAIDLASGTDIYWTAQTLSAFTPASGQTFTLIAEVEQA